MAGSRKFIITNRTTPTPSSRRATTSSLFWRPKRAGSRGTMSPPVRSSAPKKGRWRKLFSKNNFARSAGRFKSSQVHGFAGADGFVDGHHDFYVAQTFLARHFRRLVVQDALREVVHLRRELIHRREVDQFTVAAFALDAAVAVSW